MDLNALRMFAAVVEHGGFSRAASAIHVSQPAVSRAVRRLERRAGLTLIERGARTLLLTDAGEVLYEHARAIFAVERAAEEELRARLGLKRGTLRIGASTTIATYLLPPFLAAFQQRHPGVELRLASANTWEIARRMWGYELDVALVEGPVDDDRVTTVPWRTDELVVVAPGGHLLASRETVAVEELEQEQFLIREPGSGTRAVAEAALRARGIELRRTVELGSTEAIKQSVAAGLGLAIISRTALAGSLELGTLAIIAVEGLNIRRALSRLVLPGRTPGAAARAFDALLLGSP